MSGGEEKTGNISKRKRFRTRKNPKQRKYKKRKQKKNQTIMAHSEGSAKPKHNYGQSFWCNYRKAMEWQKSCMEGYWKQRAQMLHQENLILRQQLSKTSQEYTSCSDEVHFMEETYSEEDSEGISSSVQSEYEVSEEFMKFIEISLKHKEAREKEKKSKKEDKGASNSNEMQSEDSYKGMKLSAPAEDSGAKRSEEMKELYGVNSAKIHGMETAMHLSFMRKCDKNKPVLWPVVPLSNSFSTSVTR